MAATLVVFCYCGRITPRSVWNCLALMPDQLVTKLIGWPGIGFSRSRSGRFFSCRPVAVILVVLISTYLPVKSGIMVAGKCWTPFVSFCQSNSGWQLNAADTKNFLVQMAGNEMTGLIAAASKHQYFWVFLIVVHGGCALYMKGAFLAVSFNTDFNWVKLWQ